MQSALDSDIYTNSVRSCNTDGLGSCTLFNCTINFYPLFSLRFTLDRYYVVHSLLKYDDDDGDDDDGDYYYCYYLTELSSLVRC